MRRTEFEGHLVEHIDFALGRDDCCLIDRVPFLASGFAVRELPSGQLRKLIACAARIWKPELAIGYRPDIGYVGVPSAEPFLEYAGHCRVRGVLVHYDPKRVDPHHPEVLRSVQEYLDIIRSTVWKLRCSGDDEVTPCMMPFGSCDPETVQLFESVEGDTSWRQ